MTSERIRSGRGEWRIFSGKSPGRKDGYHVQSGPAWIRMLERTMNGSRVGTRVKNHRFSPIFAPSKTRPGKNSRITNRVAQEVKKENFFHKNSRAFFLHYMLNEEQEMPRKRRVLFVKDVHIIVWMKKMDRMKKLSNRLFVFCSLQA